MIILNRMNKITKERRLSNTLTGVQSLCLEMDVVGILGVGRFELVQTE